MEDFKNLKVWSKAHELDDSNLQAHLDISSRRNVRPHESDSSRLSIHRRQYRGGLWAQIGPGDEAIHSDRMRIG